MTSASVGMTSAAKPSVTRRMSMPAMPAGGSILVKDGQKNRTAVDRSSSDRRRKVSFEQAVSAPRLSSPGGPAPRRRHSSTLAPHPSNLTIRSGQPLESLSELTGPQLEERQTVTDLIEACIKDAEVMHRPAPLPKGSKDMDEILKDLQGLGCSGDSEHSNRNTELSGENTSKIINGYKNTSAQQQQQQNVNNKNHLSVQQQDKQLRQRRVSAPVTKAPNINQLVNGK